MTDGKALSLSELLEEYYDALHDAYDAMRSAFKRREITQDELARRLGIDKALVSKRLNGQENLTLKTLSFMASAMGYKLTIGYTPYEEIGAVEHSDSTEKSATYVEPKRNSSTDEGAAALEPHRMAA